LLINLISQRITLIWHCRVFDSATPMTASPMIGGFQASVRMSKVERTGSSQALKGVQRIDQRTL
jgi:hypothetical protein